MLALTAMGRGTAFCSMCLVSPHWISQGYCKAPRPHQMLVALRQNIRVESSAITGCRTAVGDFNSHYFGSG